MFDALQRRGIFSSEFALPVIAILAILAALLGVLYYVAEHVDLPSEVINLVRDSILIIAGLGGYYMNRRQGLKDKMVDKMPGGPIKPAGETDETPA